MFYLAQPIVPFLFSDLGSFLIFGSTVFYLQEQSLGVVLPIFIFERNQTETKRVQISLLKKELMVYWNGERAPNDAKTQWYRERKVAKSFMSDSSLGQVAFRRFRSKKCN